jgi:tubulin polyglutamylase TTLL1
MSQQGTARIKWRVEVDRSVICSNFERRGWQRCDDDSWNVFWASVHTVRQIFNPDSGTRLGDHQLINHFPNHYELTRKDLMVKNLKRYRKDFERENSTPGAGGGDGGGGGAASSSASPTFGIAAAMSDDGGAGGADDGADATARGGGAGGSAGGSGDDGGGGCGGGSSNDYGGGGGGGSGGGGGGGTGGGGGGGGGGPWNNNFGAHTGAAGGHVLDFCPLTYTLPADYSIFVEEFRRSPRQMWIMKPTGAAQGKGIFIINKLSQIKKWSHNGTGAARWARSGGANDNAYVISRYVENPLLIGGKKFDLRLYVLVTSFRPLRVFLHRDGFARFCNVKYSADLGDMDNPFIHLTNVAIQKNFAEYNKSHGGKFHIENLRLLLLATRGEEKTRRLFEAINEMIVHSLRSVKNVIVNDRHCFECYGYDVIIDDNLKPWLVEVNASPSLSASTPADRLLKSQLMSDVFDIVVPPDLAERSRAPDGMVSGRQQRRTAPASALGGASPAAVRAHPGFDVLVDEMADMETAAASKEAAASSKAGRTRAPAASWR